MKKLVASLVMIMLIVLASVSTAKAASVEVQVPLRGSIEGIESHIITFPTMNVNGSGSGKSSLLGKFSILYTGVVNLPTSTSTDLSAEFTAVNGDTLDAVGHGQGNPIGNITYVTEWYTITGGTGRFAGATGSFTLTRQIDHTTGVTFGDYNGTLVLTKGH